jgi:hypothetical protein
VILIGILSDIFIRLRYNAEILQFDSNEFNNLVTPFTTIVGIVVIFITLLYTKNQLKKSSSDDFYDFYKDLFQKVKGRNSINISGNYQIKLLGFLHYVDSIYNKLILDNDYIIDLGYFRDENRNINIRERTYHHILSDLYFFRLEALFLNEECIRIIKEIQETDKLSDEHRGLLLEQFIADIIDDHISDCKLLNERFSNIKTDLYLSFDRMDLVMIDSLQFFNNGFFKLFDFVMNDKDLKKYYDKYEATK